MGEDLNTGVISTDNSSSEISGEEISKALDEPDAELPENTEEVVTTPDKPKDNVPKGCPEKFINKDGSVNIENLINSYKGLEPLLNERANWDKERADYLKLKEQVKAQEQARENEARQAGFNSAQEMTQAKEIATLEANEYRRYLHYTDEPETVAKLLDAYEKNPTPELMEDIEMEFSGQINKRVGAIAEQKKLEHSQQAAEYAKTKFYSTAEEVISRAVDENPEIFNYEPFNQMFVNAFTKYGENFTYDDASALINTFQQMKELYRAEFEKEAGIKLQNNQATDKLATITGNNSAPASSQHKEVSIEGLSRGELDKVIRQYI